MKHYLWIAIFLVGCATVPPGDPPPPPPPPTSGGAMGYPPGPDGFCSAKAVEKVAGLCYDEENFKKLCNRNTYSLDQRCAGLIDRPDR